MHAKESIVNPRLGNTVSVIKDLKGGFGIRLQIGYG